jgi:DNA phosphorothioation-dependent restriction protein DptH
MRFMVNTIVDHIMAKVLEGSAVIRIVLPSYPPEVLYNVGCRVEELCHRSDKKIRFEYGIPNRLSKEWMSRDELARILSEKTRQRGWICEQDNLTRLRNLGKDEAHDCLLVLLAGYDHIEEQGSLRDFFHLDQQAIWDICLDKTFIEWVREAIKDYVNLDDAEGEIGAIADALKVLHENGLAHVLDVSRFLEMQDFSKADQGDEAYRVVMEGLPHFGLPPMPSLSRRHPSKRRFASYVGPAQEFFNYSMFIDASKRKKALETIRDFDKASDREVPDAYILGDFASCDDPLRELTEELSKYIEERSEEAKVRLRTVDFVYLYENVLGYKPKNGNNGRKPGTRKLVGLPPEVFLRGLWITLGDFIKNRKTFLAADRVGKIKLESVEFRHDFEGDEAPVLFLRRALGGIDHFFQERLRFQGKQEDIEIEIESHLVPHEGCQIVCRRHSSAEPYLKFSVSISLRDHGDPFIREFIWALPQFHQTRLLLDLFTWASDGYKKGSDVLPVFVMPYLGEVAKARDEESVNRIIDAALSSEKQYIADLFKAEGLTNSDRAKLLEVSFSHQEFTKEVLEGGFFKALSTRCSQLTSAYEKACRMQIAQGDESLLAPLLLKAFMVVPVYTPKNPGWMWDAHLRGAMVTPLHPALLEMILHQSVYLCDSFCYYAMMGLQEVDGRTFTEGRWDRVVELATIHRPVFGTLKDGNLVLDTTAVGYGYFHLVGEFEQDRASISAKLLLQDELVEEEEDITSVELFRETQASVLIERALLDYRKLHPHADDGLTIGAYCSGDIQPLIAGIDAYLASSFKERAGRPYSLKLVILSDSRYDANLIRWVNAWKERWQDAEGRRQHYADCVISVSYSIIPAVKSLEHLKKAIEGSFFDILFFVNFIPSTANRFVELGHDYLEDYQKFPVLGKIACRQIGGGMDNRRQRVISNRRFKLGAAHAEIMARLTGLKSESHVIISTSDFQPWMDVIDQAHKQSGWVVCIDPSIDDQLVRRLDHNQIDRREIIGFGAGVGAHGENNYTISTEQFSIADVSRRIGKQLPGLFGSMEVGLAEKMAASLVDEASQMAGLSIVKATGPSQYVRDYVAYALVRRLLPRDEDAFCDELISLDAFWHWFDDADDKRRPDLLRIRAVVEDGYFRILAQVIECKLARHSEGYLETARQQLEQGLSQLVARFRPRKNLEPLGIDGSMLPDQRFWWMQLHRLIATRGAVRTVSDATTTLRALERLSDGLFDITWQGAAVAFWTDVETSGMESNPPWQFYLDGQTLDISVITAGRDFPRRVCLDGVKMDFFSESKLSYTSPRVSEKEQPREERVQEEPLSTPEPAEEAPKSRPDVPTITVSSPWPFQRILLGGGTSGGRQVFWEFGHPELPNRHMLIFGASGTGKTYTIQALLWELARTGQNSLIVDYTNGFSTNQLETQIVAHLQPRQHIIRSEPLPINPFRRQEDFIEGQSIREAPADVARRVSDLFANVYSIGEQQKATLYAVIRDGVKEQGDAFNLTALVERLQQMTTGGPAASWALSLLNKIQPFIDMEPFGKEDRESWERLFTDNESRCHIIQLTGFTKDSARLITEFALFDFYWFYRSIGSKDYPKVLVLDEIQDLDHRPDSPLAQLLTQGRKFGVSLVLATQTMSNFDKEKRDRLFQASHKLFFKPADSEVRSFAQILADATNQPQSEWVTRLSSLKRGECYSLGFSWNENTKRLEVGKSYRIRIASLEERV